MPSVANLSESVKQTRDTLEVPSAASAYLTDTPSNAECHDFDDSDEEDYVRESTHSANRATRPGEKKSTSKKV